MANKPTPVAPSVHLNGSGFKNLSDQYREAIEKISEAINALPIPHGRDYYTQEDGVFQKARVQFKDQVLKLEEVREELKIISREICRRERGEA